MTKQTFPIRCKGRGEDGSEVLENSVEVKVRIYQIPDSNTISSMVENCPYNTGGHGQRCKASHPDVDKIEEDIWCPYSFDI